jgi:hypothetical protein
MVGREKTSAFASIVGKVQARLDGWKERLLSQAGRKILLKAAIQSIPTYCMSVFLLPKTLCKKLNTLSSRFWWGGIIHPKGVPG